ncbi:uncharacterized protein LOC114366074 [Ostrinia furnacalis]|uniref:uncharacterized protein LOC114366074 n=1 Tax=Ostrinia furnacalis TaxID=93504 RepID=UPI00103BEE27|nr:uncharacterized protein LOC114366074 [Ostrinia furnacalis]
MPPKGLKSPTLELKSSTYGDSDGEFVTPRSVSLTLLLEGDPPGPGDWPFLTFFNGQIVLEGKWQNGLILETEALPLDLKDIYFQQLVAEQPLIFILRTIGGKGAKDPDPLLNMDNRAGATVDLLPLVLGEDEVNVRVSLVMLTTGERTNCVVEAYAKANGVCENTKVPLTLTMLSAHCLPFAREGTVYLAAIGLNDITDRIAVNFGMSLSTNTASKVVWASASNAGQGANTMYNVPYKDRFIPQDFEPRDREDCNSVYWNAMKRVLVDPVELRERLSSPFLIEIAGVPRMGKIDVRGRYMGMVDAGVLLESGQYGVIACTKLLFYNEAELPDNVGALLELPPTSAKVSARETDLITDDFGHNAYIAIRFDVTEPLVAKSKISWLYEILGFLPPDGQSFPIDGLEIEMPQEDPLIDVRRIRKEGGALAVHKELSGLACRGAVPMNQGIKRTAANRLLMRVRTMLKQFAPGDCTYIEWQDTVTAQHAASRRAVTASFAPQPPAPHATSRVAAARSRLAGDTRIAEMHIENNLKVGCNYPRPLLAKALRCLEERNEMDARIYLLQAMSAHIRNRFLLWAFGALEFDKGDEGYETASAAFRIAIKGDYSEGTTNAIGWAALHALYHYHDNMFAAFVSAKKMRKAYELPREWKKFLSRWVEISGEEETFWIPHIVSFDNPMLIAAAFFLCLRCYAFSERLLQCYELGCATRGSRFGIKTKTGADVYYVRAAACLIQREIAKALVITDEGIQKFGPSPMMSQMRATCLACARGWDGECEKSLSDAERAGAESCPSLLLKAALSGFKIDPGAALQRAARAHKIAPSAHSALTIGRIYAKLGEEGLAERWASAAVKTEPMLADGWAVLALLAMYQRDVNKARTMLRTAKQVGPLSPDIDEEVKKVMDIIQVETLPDTLVKNLCFCDYY